MKEPCSHLGEEHSGRRGTRARAKAWVCQGHAHWVWGRWSVCVRSKVFAAGFTRGLWILASKLIVQTKIVYPGLEPWPSFWESLKSVSGCQSWRLSSCQWTEKTGFLGRRVTVLIWNVCGDIDGSLMLTTDGICMTKGLGKRRVEWSYSCVQRTSGLWLSLTLYKLRKLCLT